MFELFSNFLGPKVRKKFEKKLVLKKGTSRRVDQKLARVHLLVRPHMATLWLSLFWCQLGRHAQFMPCHFTPTLEIKPLPAEITLASHAPDSSASLSATDLRVPYPRPRRLGLWHGVQRILEAWAPSPQRLGAGSGVPTAMTALPSPAQLLLYILVPP